eukprot:TRINITY_DN27195_c0_g1_i1.p1 TRINITY_DN27195_c0_g1~~TRINITY_DN27195_c0_g1_i1.p1  ORF type:complete len:582 (+),score=200.61 TRINITY_DN27195_c0_g1_i1:40-1785(+)
MLQVDSPVTPKAQSQARASWYSAKDKSLLLRKAADESKGEIEGLQENVSTLQGAIAGHANALNMYKQQIRRKEDENRTLSQELKVLQADMEQTTERNRALELALRMAEDAKRKALSAASEMEQETFLKNARSKDQTMRLDNLDYELTAANQKINAYETELAELRRRLITADSQNEALTARADSATLQLRNVEHELQDFQHATSATERRCQDEQRQRSELEAMIKRLEGTNEQLNEKRAAHETSFAELQREVAMLPAVKSQLADTQRKLAAALESRNGASLNLMKSEEALAEALTDSSLVERLRGELNASTNRIAAMSTQLLEADASRAESEAIIMNLRHELDVVQATAQQSSKEVRNLEAELHNVTLEVSRSGGGDQGELEVLRESLQESRTECEELAAGVEKLHSMAEQEKSRRLQVEAYHHEMHKLGTMPGHTMDIITLAEERDMLMDQLTQVVSSLDMIWNELAPFAFSGAINSTPLDGQLAELAVVGARMFKASQRTGARLREVVTQYISVLNPGARRNAEAAMEAETTDDTDDLEVSLQLLSLILEKLVADISNAKNIIEEQNIYLTSHARVTPVI